MGAIFSVFTQGQQVTTKPTVEPKEESKETCPSGVFHVIDRKKREKCEDLGCEVLTLSKSTFRCDGKQSSDEPTAAEDSEQCSSGYIMKDSKCEPLVVTPTTEEAEEPGHDFFTKYDKSSGTFEYDSDCEGDEVYYDKNGTYGEKMTCYRKK
tara:strand:+ start:116 stop:571 length:456 start_codon:yes stop_codon:yes gene_type:complete